MTRMEMGGDLVELNLTSNLPINGENYPLGVPNFGDEAREIDNCLRK